MATLLERIPPQVWQKLAQNIANAKTAATFTPGPGLQVTGSAADQKAFLDLVRREMARSQTMRDLMTTINNDAAHPVKLDVGRSQPGHFVDAFNGGGKQTLDLDDIQQFPLDAPKSHPEGMVQGEQIVHALAEAREGALGQAYGPAHAAAIDAENKYRADLGQSQKLMAPPNDTSSGAGGSVIFNFDGGYKEEVHVGPTGDTITGITRH